jgi:hypothetical protein
MLHGQCEVAIFNRQVFMRRGHRTSWVLGRPTQHLSEELHLTAFQPSHTRFGKEGGKLWVREYSLVKVVHHGFNSGLAAQLGVKGICFSNRRYLEFDRHRLVF